MLTIGKSLLAVTAGLAAFGGIGFVAPAMARSDNDSHVECRGDRCWRVECNCGRCHQDGPSWVVYRERERSRDARRWQCDRWGNCGWVYDDRDRDGDRDGYRDRDGVSLTVTIGN
jgi:hypothetical protein